MGFDSNLYLGHPDFAAKTSNDLFSPLPRGDRQVGNLEDLFASAKGQGDGQEDPITGAEETLQQARGVAESHLANFATIADFDEKMNLAFGESRNVAATEALAKAWETGDFSGIPEIEIRPTVEINGAASAFAGATNTIYISREYLSYNADNVEVTAGVLLEEIGHAVDALVNEADSPGDEGAIFSALVRGQTLEPQHLEQMKAEDDTASITLDGQVIQIEQAESGLKKGGFEGSVITIPLESNGGGTAQYFYKHFNIPDRFILRYEGKNILDTGFVGGSRTGEVGIPQGTSNQLEVILATNDIDTEWQYSVSTSPPSAPSAIADPNIGAPNITDAPIFDKHSKYEFFAKDVAYKTWTEGQVLKDSDFYQNKPEFQNLVGSYRVAKVFQDVPPNNVTGFYAVGLTSDNPAEPTVLAIRGTEPPKPNEPLKLADIFTDTNPNGIGFDQFAANQEVTNWLIEQNSPDITGHSLGGALTQFFAVDSTSKGGELGEIVTFNSPGIDDAFANLFNPNLSGDVTHYIVSGDLVSLAGEEFLPGTYRLFSYPGFADYLTSLSFNKHLNPILVNGVGYDSTEVTTVLQPGTEQELSNSTDVLNSPLFTYVDPEFFGFVIGMNTGLNNLPFPQTVQDLPPWLLLRGTLEAKRRDFGRYILLRSDELNLDGGSGIGGTIEFPEIKFSLLNLLDVEATDLQVSYESKPEDRFKIQGKVTLPTLFNATADFVRNNIDEDADNFIQITKSGVDVRGVASIEPLKFSKIGGWGISRGELFFDTIENEFGIKGTVVIPTGIEISGGGSIRDGQLNSLTVEADNLNKPIGTTGAFLQRITGLIDNLADPDPNSIEFGGGIGLTAGPKIPQFDASLLELDLDGTISSDFDQFDFQQIDFQQIDLEQIKGIGKIFQQIEGIGKIKIIRDNITTGQGRATLNFNKKLFSFVGELSIFDGLIKGGATFKADSNFNMNIKGGVEAVLPPEFGGGRLGDGELLLSFSNDNNLSNDFASAWGRIGEGIFSIELGFTGFFDGRFSLTPQKVPQTNSFTVEPGTEWLLLNANWENAANNVQVRIDAPDGSVFTENNFPTDKIAIANELTNTNSKGVIILNPEPGVWDINIADSTGLGNVQYSAFRDSKTPTIEVTSPITDVSEQNVTINYNAFDADSNAKVSLFYDTDNQGFDGILIADNLAETDGTGSFTWNTEGVPTGDYYIYAMVMDENNPPSFSYSPGRVQITESADLSLSKTISTDPVTVGSNLTYAIAVTNNGSNTARDVVLTDALPEGLSFVSASVTATPQDRDLVFNLGDLPSGASTTVNVTVNPESVGTIAEMTASATTKTFDSDATNDVTVSAVEIVPPNTDLSVTTDSSPVSLNLGEQIVYNLTVTNNGSITATDVDLVSNLPSEIKDVLITSSKGVASQTNGVVTANLGNLNSGEAATVTISASSIAAGTFTNTTTVASNEADLNPANNSLIQRTTVNPATPAAADLELTKTVDNPNPNIGDQITFTLTLTNKGAGVASGIQVTDLLPPELSFVSAESIQGTYDPITGIWNVGNMRDNLSRTLNITALVNTGGSIATVAEVTTVGEPDPDSTPGNNNPDEDDRASVSLNGSGGSRDFKNIFGIGDPPIVI